MFANLDKTRKGINSACSNNKFKDCFQTGNLSTNNKLLKIQYNKNITKTFVIVKHLV